MNGEILWNSLACSDHAVVKCIDTVIVKIVPLLADYNEHDTMEYLKQHAPTIPVPKPLGLLASKDTGYIVMSFIPGQTVKAVWSTLSIEQKSSMKNQLEQHLAVLRRIQRPTGGLLGAIRGGGCKDTRRHVRVSEHPMHNAAEFRDFLFSKPTLGPQLSSRYLKISWSKGLRPSSSLTAICGQKISWYNRVVRGHSLSRASSIGKRADFILTILRV